MSGFEYTYASTVSTNQDTSAPTVAAQDVAEASVTTDTSVTANTSEDEPEAMDIIKNSDNMNMDKANTVIPEIPDTPYHKYFMFDTTRVMKGIFASSSFYFNVPDYWDTQFVYVGIAYEVSSLVTGDVPASLTFLVNDVPVYSCYIKYDEGKEQMAYFAIPIKLLKQGYNMLSISSYVKIYSSEGCTEDQSWSNWVNIDGNSFVYAGYDLVDDQSKISYYPYPFISSVNPSGEHTGILVSDTAADGELSAAMYLMADISTLTEEEDKISLCKYQDAAEKGITNKILISTTGDLPQELQKYLKKDYNDTSAGAEVYDLSSRAMVRFVHDQDNNPLLLIVADKEADLMEAAQMLLDDDRISQEKNSITFVNEGTAATVSESKKLSQLVAGSYTIDGLAGQGLSYIGPFHSEQTIYLPFGNDYVLSSAGKISLKFRYSENLDFTQSLITVFWGDVPIASKRLTKENAASDELTFTMPSDVVGTSASSIVIAFDLEIAGLFCSMRQDEMPWAYVTGDSMLYLPSRENNVLSFNYFPSPYQQQGIFDDVMIVVSDNIESSELELLSKAIALYGYQVSPYGSIKVIKASEFDEKDSDYNIITVGTYNNTFIQKINGYLPFQYNSAGDAFNSNNKLVLSDGYARDIAAFQLLNSPYSAERSIFAICATGEATLNQAYSFLENNQDRWKLKGDCVLLDSDQDLKSFTFIEKQESEDKPSIQEFVKDNKKSLIFTIMAAASMIMLLTASILILTRARKYNKKEDKDE
jgi:hypothetical protein